MRQLIDYMTKPKKRGKRTVGRPTRDELGLEPMVAVHTRVEKSVIDAIVATFGTVNKGLRKLAADIKRAG